MRNEDLSAIRALRLFSAMQEDAFAQLMRHGVFQRFPPGVTLIRQGERPDFLHVVVEGLVEMYATSAGRETTLDLVRPVRTFILAAVLGDLVQLQSARTLEPTRILMVPAEQVRAAVAADAAFMQAIIAELGRNYRGAMRSLKDQKLRAGTGRLANWLLRLRGAQGGATRLDLGCEKRTLAAWLGMTPENLSRAFVALRAHGVRVHGARVEVTDPDALIAFAHPDPLLDGED